MGASQFNPSNVIHAPLGHYLRQYALCAYCEGASQFNPSNVINAPLGAHQQYPPNDRGDAEVLSLCQLFLQEET